MFQGLAETTCAGCGERIGLDRQTRGEKMP